MAASKQSRRVTSNADLAEELNDIKASVKKDRDQLLNTLDLLLDSLADTLKTSPRQNNSNTHIP